MTVRGPWVYPIQRMPVRSRSVIHPIAPLVLFIAGRVIAVPSWQPSGEPHHRCKRHFPPSCRFAEYGGSTVSTTSDGTADGPKCKNHRVQRGGNSTSHPFCSTAICTIWFRMRLLRSRPFPVCDDPSLLGKEDAARTDRVDTQITGPKNGIRRWIATRVPTVSHAFVFCSASFCSPDAAC